MGCIDEITYCISHLTQFIFLSADGPAMAMILGMVGHSGKFSCCLYCSLPGCHQKWDGHYYPMMLKPEGYTIMGCDHNDITFSDLRWFRQDVSAQYHDNLWKLLQANNSMQFKDHCLNTGLYKQTILSGLCGGLGIPISSHLTLCILLISMTLIFCLDCGVIQLRYILLIG